MLPSRKTKQLTYLENLETTTRYVAVITIAQIQLTKPELRFCTSSNPACGVTAEIRLNAFRLSIVKTFNHHHHHHHKIMSKGANNFHSYR